MVLYNESNSNYDHTTKKRHALSNAGILVIGETLSTNGSTGKVEHEMRDERKTTIWAHVH